MTSATHVNEEVLLLNSVDTVTCQLGEEPSFSAFSNVYKKRIYFSRIQTFGFMNDSFISDVLWHLGFKI